MNIDYRQAKFFTTVNDLASLPKQSKAEVAVCGRSNAGKSSLLNTLCGQNKLAFTSKLPGRTQHINYFSLNQEDIFLVDLPGYGYAKVPDKTRQHWQKLLGTYLETRVCLLGLILIMDIRHPLKDSDYTMINFFAVTDKPIHIVLSKSDKLTTREQSATMKLTEAKLKNYGLTNFSIQLFSSLKRSGIEELTQVLNSWFTV